MICWNFNIIQMMRRTLVKLNSTVFHEVFFQFGILGSRGHHGAWGHARWILNSMTDDRISNFLSFFLEITNALKWFQYSIFRCFRYVFYEIMRQSKPVSMKSFTEHQICKWQNGLKFFLHRVVYTPMINLCHDPRSLSSHTQTHTSFYK